MVVVEPLLELGAVALVFWVIATALGIALLMDKLAAILHAVPIAGGFLSSKVKEMAQAITNAAGALESGIDNLIGASWHLLARYMDRLWNNLVHHSVLSLLISQLVNRLAHAFRALEHRVEHAASVAVGALPRIKTLEREFKGIEHGVKQLGKLLLAFGGIDAVIHLLHWLRNFERHHGGSLKGIHGLIRGLHGSLSDLKRFLGIKAGISYKDWAIGIVAAALGLGVVNLFKCPTFLGKTLGRGCGLWNGLEDLFGLFIDALALTHLCDLPRWIEEFFSPILSELTSLISSAANSVCASANTDWSKLNVANGPLPPPQTLNLPDNFG